MSDLPTDPRAAKAPAMDTFAGRLGAGAAADLLDPRADEQVVLFDGVRDDRWLEATVTRKDT